MVYFVSFINISDNKNFVAKMEVGFIMELGLYSYQSETRAKDIKERQFTRNYKSLAIWLKVKGIKLQLMA